MSQGCGENAVTDFKLPSLRTPIAPLPGWRPPPPGIHKVPPCHCPMDLSCQPLAFEPLPTFASSTMYIGRICSAGGHHPKGGPSLRAARAAARAQARQVSRLPGRGSGVGRVYPRGPAVWLQELGVPLFAGVTSPSTTSLAEGGAAYRGQAGADRGGGRQAATPASGLEPVRHAAGAAPAAMAPRRGAIPDGRDHPAAADRGKGWLDSVARDRGVMGGSLQSHTADPQPACSQQQPQTRQPLPPSPERRPQCQAKGRARHPGITWGARLRAGSSPLADEVLPLEARSAGRCSGRARRRPTIW